MRCVRLGRQAVRAVRFYKYIVCQPGKPLKGQAWREELSVFCAGRSADGTLHLKRRAQRRFRRVQQHRHVLRRENVRRRADEHPRVCGKHARKRIQKRGLAAASDDGRHAGPDTKCRR